jgi:hypothetical protein
MNTGWRKLLHETGMMFLRSTGDRAPRLEELDADDEEIPGGEN